MIFTTGTELVSERLYAPFRSWDIKNSMAGVGRRGELDGHGFAGKKSGRSLQLLWKKVLFENGDYYRLRIDLPYRDDPQQG